MHENACMQNLLPCFCVLRQTGILIPWFLDLSCAGKTLIELLVLVCSIYFPILSLCRILSIILFWICCLPVRIDYPQVKNMQTALPLVNELHNETMRVRMQ